jgi:asparagine synthase (glutamine-hydrolysing)
MAHGLEVRVPLLGNALADFALAQPAASHLVPEPKALLRRLARDKLPAEVWSRPKHGFSVPLRESFAGPWRELCADTIARTRQIAPFLRADAVESLWRRQDSRRLLYTFVVLLLWLERARISA